MQVRRFHRSRWLALVAALVISACFVGLRSKAADAPQPDPAIAFDKEVTPLLQKYCYQCHGNGKAKADLALDSFKTAESVLQSRRTWEEVLKNVRTRVMPPEEAKLQPTQAERDVITGWIEKQFYKSDPKNPDPGRVTIRRLNRAEYSNTIRDLVGVEFDATADFPPDDSGYGFDNIGDVLSLPPVLMEKYLAATDRILDQAIPTEPVKSTTRRIPASLAQVGFNAIGDRGDGWVQLISLEDDDVAVELPVSTGDYLVRVMAFSSKTGGALVGQGSEKPLTFDGDVEPTKVGIFVDNAFVQDFDTTRDEKNPGIYEARVSMSAGKHRIRAVNRRTRGGANELIMLNGRIGKQQPGVLLVKYIEVEGPLPAAARFYRADKLEAVGDGRNLPGGARLLDHNGEVATKIDVPAEREYILRAQACADQSGDEPARMEFRIDGQPIKSFDVIAPATLQPTGRQRPFSLTLLQQVPYVYEFRTRLPAGQHRFAAAFVNDHVDAENANVNLRDRNLYIDYLEVVDLNSPAVQPEMPQQIKQLFATAQAVDDKSQAARQMLGPFARRAFRRPVRPDEIDRLMKLYDLASKQGEGFDASVKLAMKADLVSPHFLFRGESQPDPNNPKSVHEIDEFALASRLSYFLWSSMPDDELLGLAERGELRKNLEPQVKRMLASPKSRALVDNFAAQWLQTRSLPTFQPDHDRFPAFDPGLGIAMQKETELFFDYVMRQDRSVLDFLTGDYTFINGRLAKLYGIENVTGEEFQKVSLAGTPRRGVLTQGSVLTLTSNPTRTSPVKRGKWVLENLLGTPPPPPPPDVPPLEKEGQQATGTLRQQMEQHRKDPNCAGCHARMDPIGFGLENFDGIGAWRDKDGDAAIDPAGTLVSGESFKGAVELIDILATKKKSEFLDCISDRMLTYALGRGLEYYDRPAVEQIAHSLEENDCRFSTLVICVVKSLPFQMRRGDGQQTAAR